MEKIKLNFHLKKNDNEKMTVLLRYTFLGLKEKSISIPYLKFTEEEWLDKKTCKKFGYILGVNDKFNRPENKAKFSEEILLLKDIRDEILNYVDTLDYDYLFEHTIIKDIVEFHNPNKVNEVEKPKNLLELIEDEINYQQSIGKISKGQIKNYNDLKMSLSNFGKSFFFKQLSFDIFNFNSKFIHQYEDFLISNGATNSSIRTYLKNFVSICRKISFRLNLNLDCSYKIRTNYVKEFKEVLTEEEVLEIYNYEFDDEKLNYAKKFLLLQFCIGCRFSDLKQLSCVNIVGNLSISYSSIKNNVQGIIAINDMLRSFLDENHQNLPTYKYEITTYNQSLKTMFSIVFPCEKCEYRLQSQIGEGLSKISKKDFYYKHKTISSHMIRRSFATHYLVVKGYPVAIVAQMMAHTNVATTLKYLNLSKESCLNEQLKLLGKRK